MENREKAIIAEAIQNLLVAKIRGVATDAGLVRVRYDYASGSVEAILTREDGTEAAFNLNVDVVSPLRRAACG